MTKISYDYWVAIAVPEYNVEIARSLVFQMTNNPANLRTFQAKAFKGNDVYHITQMPMRDHFFKILPNLAKSLNGEFEAIEAKIEGIWHHYKTLSQWLEEKCYLQISEDENENEKEL